MGVPAVTGAGTVEIDVVAKEMRVGDVVLREGDLLAIDGTTGNVTTDDVPLIDPEVSEELTTVLGWADELRRLDVRTNADTPADAVKARELGAQGIGLCRTEHMFFGEDRHDKMVEVILARRARSGSPPWSSSSRCSAATSRRSSRRWRGCR